MKAVGIIKTSEFKSHGKNARALEVMIPCHNNAATCYIKIKNYGDARLLSENVSPAAVFARGPTVVGLALFFQGLAWLGLAWLGLAGLGLLLDLALGLLLDPSFVVPCLALPLVSVTSPVV